MSHKEQREYCTRIKNMFPEHFNDVDVLDCGSLDINGNNRYLFTDSRYLGIDVGKGKNVDVVCPIHEYQAPYESFDTIISTECFEHDKHYKESIKNIVGMLKSGGMFIFTCATTGRAEHGTTATSPDDAPFTNDYYKNLTEEDIKEIINLDEVFSTYEFEVDTEHCDLNFYGIKR